VRQPGDPAHSVIDFPMGFPKGNQHTPDSRISVLSQAHLDRGPSRDPSRNVNLCQAFLKSMDIDRRIVNGPRCHILIQGPTRHSSCHVDDMVFFSPPLSEPRCSTLRNYLEGPFFAPLLHSFKETGNKKKERADALNNAFCL
jgi:hypothetical protein